MERHRALPLVLLAFALGCGARSSLDAFGTTPASGEAAQGGGAPVNVSSGSSSGGGASGNGSGGDPGGSSASASGSGSECGGRSDCGSNARDSSDFGSDVPSCRPGGPGMTNCGTLSETCCTSPEVPGGTYYRTYDLTADGGVILA